MQVPKIGHRLDHRLPLYRQDQAQYPMRTRVLRPHVDGHGVGPLPVTYLLAVLNAILCSYVLFLHNSSHVTLCVVRHDTPCGCRYITPCPAPPPRAPAKGCPYHKLAPGRSIGPYGLCIPGCSWLLDLAHLITARKGPIHCALAIGCTERLTTNAGVGIVGNLAAPMRFRQVKAGEGIVLPQRVCRPVRRHQNTPQVRMTRKSNAKHIIHLTLIPVCSRPDTHHCRDSWLFLPW